MTDKTPLDVLTQAETMRNAVMRAVQTGDWARAAQQIVAAEALYDVAIQEVTDPERLRVAKEGRALCDIHRADVSIRYWRLGDAEAALDRAYSTLKDGSTEGELWRVTARIAERRGRWSSAKAAWSKARKIAVGKHEGVVADAILRLAEIALNERQPEKVAKHLEELAALGIDDDLTRVRTEMVRADMLAQQGEIDGSLDIYRELSRDLKTYPQDFAALMNLRRAGVEIHRAPARAVKRVWRATQLLQRINHPDGLGLGFGQLAVLAMGMRRPIIAALAAVGANASRSGDTVGQALLEAALRQADLELGFTELNGEKLQEIAIAELAQPARQLGVAWSELGTLKGLEKLVAPIEAAGTAGVRVDVEAGEIVSGTDLKGHRCSLTWDAPLGNLRTVRLSKPVVRPQPTLYRPPVYTPGATTPRPVPAPMVVPGSRWRTEVALVLTGGGMLVLAMLGLLILVLVGLNLAKDRRPVKPTELVVVPVPVDPFPAFGIRAEELPSSIASTVPVSFEGTQAVGFARIRGPGVLLRWGGVSEGYGLPPGSYSVLINEPAGTLRENFAIPEGSPGCRVRWMKGVVLADCQAAVDPPLERPDQLPSTEEPSTVPG